MLTNMRSGGRVLVDALIGHGVDLIFGVPGKSYLATLDALHDVSDRLRFITCRHEGGAANMAEAYGKLTGKPGIAFVTRGPGACNASIGVHTAMQDSTPMILLVGQIDRSATDREAFQEVDYRMMFGPLAKWVTQIDSAKRIPELISHAFHMAVSGRPGPVVIALPEDMQKDLVDVADLPHFKTVLPHAGATDLAAIQAELKTAKRPLMIVGGGGWNAAAVADINAFAKAANLPSIAAFRCQDLIDNTTPVYVGELGTSTAASLAQRVRDADLLFVVGARLGEIATQGYELIQVPRSKQRLIHIHADSGEPGRVYYADVAVNAAPATIAPALRALKVDGSGWTKWTEAARADYVATQGPAPCPGALDMNVVMKVLVEKLPVDTIITTDAGNFSGWPARYWPFRRFRTQLGPTSGAMGYSVPAGVAAKIAEPGRIVISFVGDGGFMMTGQEIATAHQYGAAPIILVVNNGMYGTIRMHQERDYPGRVSGTKLDSPDFAAYARACGAFGATVSTTAEFAPALDAALQSGQAAVLDLRIDPEALTTRMTLTDIRTAALKRQAAAAQQQ